MTQSCFTGFDKLLMDLGISSEHHDEDHHDEDHHEDHDEDHHHEDPHAEDHDHQVCVGNISTVNADVVTF